MTVYAKRTSAADASEPLDIFLLTAGNVSYLKIKITAGVYTRRFFV